MALLDDPDVIMIGAGHNGLAAAACLARAGLRVLVLEKNDYIGGMAGTREILSGCRNEVGASCLFPLSREILEFYRFEDHGVEFIPLPIMATNFTGPGARVMMFQKNQLRQLWDMLRSFGPGALLGFIRLMRFIAYPARAMDRFTAGAAPKSLETLIAEAPNEAAREQLRVCFSASAMELIERFFPDPVKHAELRANLAFAAIQSTYKGPYTPGSALCLVFTLANEGSEGMMRRVRGGLGRLSEALAKQIEAHGGEIRTRQNVARIVVEHGRAVAVELRNGTVLRAPVIVSNLDKVATFNRLLEGHEMPEGFAEKIAAITHRGAYVHMLFKLNALPRFAPQFDYLNRDPNAHFGGAIVFDEREMQRAFELCQAGEVPARVPVAYQFPSIMDESLAPPGFHIASAYGFFYPCEAPKEKRGANRDLIARRVIDTMETYFPGFEAAIVEKAVFASDHFATMHGATGGDFTHGVIHPEQMLANRSLVAGSGHRTPVGQLYLCGSSCHPGPGVTFLPGYNCAQEILRDWRQGNARAAA